MAAHSDDTEAATRVIELCVNLDDATGEAVAAVTEALMSAGALDAWTTAIGMKKQRPGVMVSCLAAEPDADALARVLLHETGSFGVRHRAWERTLLERTFTEIPTDLGDVRVKVGRLDGRVVVAKPEHDDVAALALEAGLTVREARTTVELAVQAWARAHADDGAGA